MEGHNMERPVDCRKGVALPEFPTGLVVAYEDTAVHYTVGFFEIL
jgi:hypothetical protein